MEAMNEMVGMLEKEKAKLESELKVCCITSTPYVVKCGGLYVTPELFQSHFATCDKMGI